MNAFTSVRPRGVDAPAKAPRKTNTSQHDLFGAAPAPRNFDQEALGFLIA